jgi:hypothetical protein
MLFVPARIPGGLNLAHSKLLPETCCRCAVEARQLSNRLHQKSTPTQTGQRPLETLKKTGRKTSRLTLGRKAVSRLWLRYKFNIIFTTNPANVHEKMGTIIFVSLRAFCGENSLGRNAKE